VSHTPGLRPAARVSSVLVVITAVSLDGVVTVLVLSLCQMAKQADEASAAEWDAEASSRQLT